MGHLQDAARAGAIGVQVPPDVLRSIAAVCWNWYHAHADDTVVKRKVLVFSVTIRVRDLEGVFFLLFGPDPNGPA